MDRRQLVEEAMTLRLQRLELAVDEKLVDKKRLTCAIADLRGVKEPRIARPAGRALSPGERPPTSMGTGVLRDPSASASSMATRREDRPRIIQAFWPRARRLRHTRRQS